MNKEQIYDKSISPLMTKVIDLCKQHGIAMIASFAIPTDADGDLFVLTNLPDESGKVPEVHVNACNILRPPKVPTLMLRTDHADGSTTMTAILG